MKKKIVLLSSLVVFLIGVIFFASYLILKCGENQNTSLSINQICEANEKINTLNNSYKVNTERCEIPLSLLNGGYIEINTFCELTNSAFSGNYITKGDFTLKVQEDGYEVKVLNGKLCANLYYLAQNLGYSLLKSGGENVILVRNFAYKRLITVDATSFTFGATETLEVGDLKVLQYSSEYDAFNAYTNLTELGKNVQVDSVVSVDGANESVESTEIGSTYSVWNGEIMGFNGYAEYLTTLPKPLNDVIVAVIDSGINYGHEVFKDRVCFSYAKSFDKEDDIVDYNSHGTHVSGIIANWTPSNVKILPVKIFGKIGQSSSLNIYFALEYLNNLIDEGVNIKVINCSFGAYIYAWEAGFEEVGTKIDAIYKLYKRAYQKGVLICASAGNESINNSSKDYAKSFPACYDVVTTVSSMTSGMVFDEKYSNYGKVDFIAPGTDISSASNVGYRSTEFKSGTSMASPHIATAYALLFLDSINNYSADEILDICKMKCAVDIGDTGYDIYCGYGYIDLRNALTQSNGEFNSYLLSLNCVDENWGIIKDFKSDINLTISHFENNGKIVKTKCDNDGIKVAYTDHAIYLDCIFKTAKFDFLGWYLTDKNLSSKKLISNSCSAILPLSELKVADTFTNTNENYVFAMYKIATCAFNISFSYKDVDEYTGFASFGTTLNVKYVNDSGVSVSEGYSTGILAESQVFEFKISASEKFEYELKCENDAVVTKIIMVKNDVYIIKDIYRGWVKSGLVVPYDFDVIVLIEI